jgi:hypothetical protein
MFASAVRRGLNGRMICSATEQRADAERPEARTTLLRVKKGDTCEAELIAKSITNPTALRAVSAAGESIVEPAGRSIRAKRSATPP